MFHEHNLEFYRIWKCRRMIFRRRDLLYRIVMYCDDRKVLLVLPPADERHIFWEPGNMVQTFFLD